MVRALVVVVTLSVVFFAGCPECESDIGDANVEAAVPGEPNCMPGPIYAAFLTCYNGDIGSRSNCSMVICDPSVRKGSGADAPAGSLTCGYPGKVSKISWEFVRQETGQDVYRFERVFPWDMDEHQSTSNVVAFEGAQVVVFQDEHQAIVVDAPR